MPQVSQIQRTTSAATLSCRLKRMTQRQSCSAGITRIFKCQGRGSKLSKSCRCQGCDPTADCDAWIKGRSCPLAVSCAGRWLQYVNHGPNSGAEQKLGALREELKLFGRDPNEAGKR